MSEKDEIVMEIDKPHFTVRLHRALLEVDLKEGLRHELESFIEKRPKLRESVGLLFQTAIPLDVKLRDIESVSIENGGRVKVAIRSRRDLHIPLEADEADRLVQKLNELIPLEKTRMLAEIQESKKHKIETTESEAHTEKELGRSQETRRAI